MCGRFDNLIARDAYRGLFKAQRLPKSNFPLRYNVAPTDQIPIVRIDPRDGEREVVMARWGLIPFWMKEKPKVPHINARAETVHKLPLFREAFAKRRCLIPATGFYEWQKREDGKQPYRFRRKDLEPFAWQTGLVDEQAPDLLQYVRIDPFLDELLNRYHLQHRYSSRSLANYFLSIMRCGTYCFA